jgi:ABC-type protease/lipase transport system fused ATPase/permease subunit
MTIDCKISKSVDILPTARVKQLEGIFDIPPSRRSEQLWHHHFTLPETWNIGVIVGPSGSGKTTLARHAFGENIVTNWDWPECHSVNP